MVLILQIKKGVNDDRSKFIDKLIRESRGKISFNILGLYKEEPKWNFELNNEIMKSKIALNLSRGVPARYYSSNRIATLMEMVFNSYRRKSKIWSFL